MFGFFNKKSEIEKSAERASESAVTELNAIFCIFSKKQYPSQKRDDLGRYIDRNISAAKDPTFYVILAW